MSSYGFAGSILRVDLSTGRKTTRPTADCAGRFLGGRGLAAKIYWDEVGPSTGALDPENLLIMALGPMAGVPAVGASRWGIFAKSPLPSPAQFCYGNLGGGFGAELKFAGYDALVVEGRADRPVVLSISDDTIELIDGTDLWGRGAIEIRQILQERIGPRVKVAAIGSAGENLVPTAIVLADGDASCSGGMGAVMGSKNLKAIAVRGSRRKTPVADPDRLKAIVGMLRGIERGNTKVWGLDFMAHGPRTKKLPCYGCMAKCLRVSYLADDGSSGKFMCQSRFFYFVYALMHYQAENDVPFKANKLCDDFGIDTWELQKLIEWLLACSAEGVLTEEGTGIPFSNLGSLEFITTLVRMIAERSGIGDVLAAGRDAAAEIIGGSALDLVKHNDPYEPRLYLANALVYPFEPREPIQQVHEVGLTMAQWVSWVKGTAGTHISTDVLRGIAARFWGGEPAMDSTTYDGKALAAKLIQDRQYAKESLMVCDWMYPVLDKPAGDDHVGDPGVEASLFSAVTGIETDEAGLRRYGERAFNLQRAILLREGRRPPGDDFLPAQWHTDPLDFHSVDPDLTAPGPGGKPVSRRGAVISRPDFENMLREYYGLRGWDPAFGLQKRKGLVDLDLPEVADDLETRGLLSGG
jgi:aldehyde:ferredoxin oxidoreductase